MIDIKDYLQKHFAILLVIQLSVAALLAVGVYFYIEVYIPYTKMWAIVLYNVAFAVVFGADAALTVACKKPCSFKKLLFWFGVGAIGFAALFNVIMGVVNIVIGAGNVTASYVGIGFIGAAALACTVAQDVLLFGVKKKVALVVVAIITLVGFIATGLTKAVDRTDLFKFFSTSKITFNTLSATETEVSDTEKLENFQWFKDYILEAPNNGKLPAYNFTVSGKEFRDNLSDWDVSAPTDGVSSAYGDGITQIVTLTSGSEKLSVTVEATYYESTATSEWTLYIKNTGESNSAVISDFYPLDTDLNASSAKLYFSSGSDCANDDFELFSRKLRSARYKFSATDGRSSTTYLPYFNVEGESGGFTVGVGWTGNWETTFSKASEADVSVTVRQSGLEAYLLSGESVRSPLVSVSFYKGSNALKGFNTFRKQILNLLPDDYTQVTTLAFSDALPESTDENYVAERIDSKMEENIQKLKDAEILDTVDYIWFDAMWFDMDGTRNWFDHTGDWNVDETLFPDGLKKTSETFAENDIGLILWYEPERVAKSTEIYKLGLEKGWILDNGDDDCVYGMWNLGNDDALKYLSEYIDASIKENGVSFYRQDFNTAATDFFKKTDKNLGKNRNGITENKYVGGLYAFWDYLTEHNEGLIIDNCSSGGRRFDMETCRRAIPLWRSDYNCFPEYKDMFTATQNQTYGLSLWLPVSCVGNLASSNMYEYRSTMTPVAEFYSPFLFNDTENYKKYIQQYFSVREYMLKNYYPLTSCSLSTKETVAFQFGDGNEGMVMIFAREKAKADVYEFSMNGLYDDGNYTLTDLDCGELYAKSGKELTDGGLTVSINETPSAKIITYKKAG